MTEVNPAGDIPDTQAFVDYASPAGGWSIQIPEGWSRTDSATAVMFSDKYNSVTVELTAVDSAPSVETAQAEMTALQSSGSGFVAGAVSVVDRPAGSAVLITYRLDSPVNNVTGKVVVQDVERYEWWSSGRQATVTVAAPVGSDNVDPWRTVTDSFRWTS